VRVIAPVPLHDLAVDILGVRRVGAAEIFFDGHKNRRRCHLISPCFHDSAIRIATVMKNSIFDKRGPAKPQVHSITMKWLWLSIS
jgi:hypothetical protein